MTPKQKLILLAIIAVAVFFRFYQIRQMPGGLFPDEAANGLDINLMQQGHLQPFYERGNGREALFFYMLWGSVGLFGKGPWQHHIVSALIGALSVCLCFLLARRLFLKKKTITPDKSREILPFADNVLPGLKKPNTHTYEIFDYEATRHATNIALLAAFLMAVSSWHIVLSRTAFRAVQIPLFSSLTFYFLLCVHQSLSRKKQLFYAFLAGAAFGLGFYSYIAFRIMVPILFMIIVWPWLAGGLMRQIEKYWKMAILFTAGFIIVIFPLAKYFYEHPGSLVGRAGQVSVFNPDLYSVGGHQLPDKPTVGEVIPVIFEVFKTQMKGFFTSGDLNWRSNISGYPFLSPLISPFFAIGLILCSIFAIGYFFSPRKRQDWWKYFLLFGWFIGMLLPVVATAEGIPHGLRGVGVIPAVFIISAWALSEFVQMIVKLHKKIWKKVLYHNKDPEWIKNHHFTPLRVRLVNAGAKILAVGFFIALILQSYFLYFVYAANSPENFYYFRSDLTTVSDYLVKRCNKTHTYLILDKFSVQTTDYLTSDWHGNFDDPCNVPYQQVDPENAWQLSGLTSADEIVFTQSSMFDARKFKQYHPDFHLAQEMRNKFGQSVLAVYKMSN